MNEQSPDLKGLQSFAHSIDRELSPIFVGREQETEHVLRHAELLGEDHAQGAHTQGATIVITGCPGSGKSAFLGHFARTFAKLELTNTVLVPIEYSHQDLTARNSKDLQAQFAEVAIEKKERTHRTFQALLKDAGQALKLRNTFERLQQKISTDEGKRTVVCLLVDEIQTLTEASAPAVQLLHTRSFSPPVLPIYAGLDDSVDKLEKVCGISRLRATARMTMGTLREHAAKEATEMLFEKYRVRSDTGARATWAQAIDEAALGFAQHLHVALKTACSVFIARGGTARAEDATQVKTGARAAREQFYAWKTTGMVADHAEAVLDVVHQATRTNTPVTKRHLAKWAKKSMEKHDPLSAEHSNDDALELVECMRRRGILHLSAQGRAEVPIPSLHAWLTGPYARHVGWQPAQGGKKHDPDTPGER